MAFCNNEYFEKIGHIQKNMHEAEKKRLELERELFSYCRSDQRIAQLKYNRLQRYLKEITAKEERAKARNLELVKTMESVVMQTDRLRPDRSALHHLKIECWSQISKLREKQERQQATLKNKGVSPSPVQTDPLAQSSVIFTGQQSIRDPFLDPNCTSVPSPQLSHLEPNHLLQPLLRSGLLKDACASKANTGLAISDDILDSIQFPDGTAPSQEDEKKKPGVSSDWDSLARNSEVVAVVTETCAESPLKVTLRGPKAVWPSSGLIPSPPPERLESSPSPLSSHCQPHTNSPPLPVSKVAYIPSLGSGDGALSGGHSKVVEDLEKVPEQEIKPESPDLSSSTVEISAESSLEINSDLSISISDHDLQRCAKARPFSQKSSEEACHSPRNKTADGVAEMALPNLSDCSSHSSSEDHQGMSLGGLSYLLEHIEGHLQDGDRKLYFDLAVNQQKLKGMISLCQRRADLSGEALQTCGAVALHQLRRLSWATSNGCLLPPQLVEANVVWNERTKLRSSLPTDCVPLWDRWLSHALLLLQQDVLSRKELLQVFTPALVAPGASYTEQAEALLSGLLSTSAPSHIDTQQSTSSSAGMPSILDDTSDSQQARPAGHRSSTVALQGVQSAEEDSADRGSLERIPIRETKAYQLLKQSALQHGQWNPRADNLDVEEEEDEEGSGLMPIGSLTTAKASGPEGGRHPSGADTSFRKEKTKAEALSAVQSKAFWGESDDSNSDIEIALRPQSWKSADDTDDFYD